MNVGFGLHVSRPELSPWGVFGSPVSDDLPERDVSLQSLARIGGNQSPTNTCVWWGMSQALWMTMLQMGLPGAWMSVLAGYWLTQMKTHAGDRNKVIDIGCRPPDAAAVISEVGVIKDNEWPFLAEKVCLEPKYKAIVSATRGWFKLKRIIAMPQERKPIIKHVIHKLRRVVLIGQAVSKPYVEWQPGKLPWQMGSDKIIGRHMEAMDSYTEDGPLTISSWGESFRRQLAWVQVEHPSVSEFWYPEINLDLAKQMFAGGSK